MEGSVVYEGERITVQLWPPGKANSISVIIFFGWAGRGGEKKAETLENLFRIDYKASAAPKSTRAINLDPFNPFIAFPFFLLLLNWKMFDVAWREPEF